MKSNHRTAMGEVRQLVNDPLSFAFLMSDEELKEVLARFMCELNRRRKMRGDQDRI